MLFILPSLAEKPRPSGRGSSHHQRCHELKYPADGTEEEYFEWTQDNIKPIYIWVSVENFNNDKYFNKLTENAHNLKRFTGTIDGFLKWLKDFI